MKLRIFAAFLLISGTFVIPLNATNSFGDGVFLFTIRQVAGSVSILLNNKQLEDNQIISKKEFNNVSSFE